jgi:DNA-binding transcriptional MerR regulator
MRVLTIGELSRRTGVKVPTIRWYEQAGLVDEPGRTEGNQRRYGSADVERVAFIRHARELGFDLESIRQLIDLAGHPERPCTNAHAIAAAQLSEVREKLARLRRLEAELERMTAHRAHGTAGECYVLRSLADHDLCEGEH